VPKNANKLLDRAHRAPDIPVHKMLKFGPVGVVAFVIPETTLLSARPVRTTLAMPPVFEPRLCMRPGS